MKKIVIYGAGGFAKEIIWLIEEINNVNKEWELLGLIEDNDNITTWELDVCEYKNKNEIIKIGEY